MQEFSRKMGARNKPPRESFKPRGPVVPNNRNIARAQEFQGRQGVPFQRKTESKWDIAPKGLEKYSAQQVKLAGVFSPGKKLGTEEVQGVLAKLTVPPLDPEHAKLNRSLIIEGELSPHLETIFGSAGISTNYEREGPLVRFETPMHVAVVMACPGKLTVKRPPGLITSDSPSIWSHQLTRILDPQEACKLGRSQIKQIAGQEGTILAQFTSGGTIGSPLYPIHNSVPVISDPQEFGKVPPRPSSTLVIMNGEPEMVRPLLEERGVLNIKTAEQTIVKVFARFESEESATRAGEELHLRQCGAQKLLVGFWNDQAFNLDIF